MDRLEKALWAYAPYGLYAHGPSEIVEVIGGRISTNKVLVKYPNGEGLMLIEDFGCDYDLILQPLSNLTKPIKHNGGEFVPIVELLKISEESWCKEKKGTRYAEIEYEQSGCYAKAWFKVMASKSIDLNTSFVSNFPVWIIEKLDEWKIDRFNLLESGEAVSVTETFNPYE